MFKDTALAAINAGANIRTRVTSQETMVAMAAAARTRGLHVTFVGEVSEEVAVAVASAGNGHVTFDDADAE